MPINQNLEAMAKQLYDYWFVQFDFPNETGDRIKVSVAKWFGMKAEKIYTRILGSKIS